MLNVKKKSLISVYTVCLSIFLRNKNLFVVTEKETTLCSIVVSGRWCLVNFQCWGVLLIWIIVEQGPIALAVGASGGCLDIFSHLSFLISFSLSLGDGPI